MTSASNISTIYIAGTIYVCGRDDGCRSYGPGSGGEWTKEPTMKMITPRHFAASTSTVVGKCLILTTSFTSFNPLSIVDGQTVWVVTGGKDKDWNIVKTTEVWSPGHGWREDSSLTSPLHVSRHCIVDTGEGIMQTGGSTTWSGEFIIVARCRCGRRVLVLTLFIYYR